MSNNPKLIILSEQLRGQTYELVDGKYSIGRASDRSICIVDPTVSGLHCELHKDPDGGFTAVDENFSTNGTRINGVLISRQKLVNSDILQVGSIECMYDCETNTPSSVISTQTHINIDDSVLNANTHSNLAPVNLQGGADNQKMKLVYRVVLIVLVLAVLVLSAFLVKSLIS